MTPIQAQVPNTSGVESKSAGEKKTSKTKRKPVFNQKDNSGSQSNQIISELNVLIDNIFLNNIFIPNHFMDCGPLPSLTSQISIKCYILVH